MASRKPVLLVTRNFPPLLGGMEKLNQRMLSGLSARWRPVICAPVGASGYAAPGVEVAEVPLNPLPWFLLRSLFTAVTLARRHRPGWVIAGSGLVAPIALVAARLSGARAAVYLHGLDVVVESPIYRLLWLPAIRRFDLAITNSANTAALAQTRGVPVSRLHVINPGVDTVPADPPDVPARVLWGIGERPMLISVGRLTSRKGLAEFVRNALPLIVEKVPDVVFTIIGGEAEHALHGAGSGERSRVEEAARAAGVLEHVLFAGRCEQSTLESALASADCHVFPVLDLPGDVEGFGMVALEAASLGLATVAFRVGGVPDAIADGITGRLIAAGDYEGFAAAAVDQLEKGRSRATADACRQFAAERSWDVFSARLDALLEAAQ